MTDHGQPATDDVVALSVAWEKKTGCDSIPTIERVYDRARSGAFLCPWPKCNVRWHYAGSMWRHVHSAHGRNDLPPEETHA